MTSMMKLYVGLALILILFGLGFGAGWKCHAPKPLVPSAVQPKPEIKQQDGSVVLERKVDHTAKPPMQIPQGDIVEHTGSVVIQPLPTLPPVGFVPTPLVPCPPCPPVRIHWSLVKEPDGGERLVFKADHGTVIGGEDILVTPPPAPYTQPKWAAGVTRYFREQTYGVWAERHMANLIVGAEVKQTRADFGSGKTSVDAALRVGWQF